MGLARLTKSKIALPERWTAKLFTCFMQVGKTADLSHKTQNPSPLYPLRTTAIGGAEMLEKLFRFARRNRAQPETRRQCVTRLLADLNASLVDLAEKPVITVTPNDGKIGLELPDDLPDERVALPAPEPVRATA